MKPIIIIDTTDPYNFTGGGRDDKALELREQYDELKELDPDLPPFEEWVLTQ